MQMQSAPVEENNIFSVYEQLSFIFVIDRGNFLVL
jgi:hypothetical protein